MIEDVQFQGSVASVIVKQKHVDKEDVAFGISRTNKDGIFDTRFWSTTLFNPSEFFEISSNENEINIEYHNSDGYEPQETEFELLVFNGKEVRVMEIENCQIEDDFLVKIVIFKSDVLNGIDEVCDDDVIFWVERNYFDKVVDQTLPKKISDVFRSESNSKDKADLIMDDELQKSRDLKKQMIDGHNGLRQQRDDVKDGELNKMMIALVVCCVLVIVSVGILVLIKCKQRRTTSAIVDDNHFVQVTLSQNI